MKLTFLPLLLLSLTLRAEPPGIDQSSELLTVPAGDKFLRWYGHAGRSYFLQVSDANDHLGKWNWAPIIEGGNDEEISYEVDGTAAKGFFRLKYTDQVPGPAETLETADFDNDGRSNFNEISPPPPLSAIAATDPTEGDTDHDGLLDGFELAYGFDPNNPDEDDNNVLDGADDSDDDGWSNADEADAGTDPNNPDDDPNTPAEPWVIVVGDGAQDVPMTETRTFTIKKDQSRILVLGTTSLEFPYFTGTPSQWNDLLEWKITPSSGDTIEGSLNVNDRHEDWEIDEANGVTLHDFGPSPAVHIETVRVIRAPADADMTVKVKLTVTNIGDGTLPSTLIVGLLPVKFITPAGNPVSGPVDAANVADSSASVPDGANEFTFSPAASGVLTMKLRARIPDIDLLPLAEQTKFKFELDGIGNSTFAWDSANAGGKVSVSGDFITATATYTGLPLSNSDFGLKKTRMMYDGEKIAEEDFEVFFPGDATNHPQGQADSANWFYYWKDGQVCGIPADAIYDATNVTSFGYTLADQDSILRLCPAAPTVGGAPLTLISTITKPGSSPPETYGTITVGASGAGILCVAQTVSHELFHITMYADLTGKADVDTDGVADSSEGSLGGIQSSTAHPDTYGISSLGGVYADYATYGDEEVRGMKQESNVTFPVLPTKDWANPGCQSADQHGPQP